MRYIFGLLLITLFSTNMLYAQPQKGRFIDASIGFGISIPSDDIDIEGSGFYAQAEYVFAIKKWFGVRPYAGVIFTSPTESENPSLSEYRVSSDALMLGGKARVCAPIPWFAPYFEVGLGASFGKFETYTPFDNIEKKGVLMHIPLTFGVALGKKHNVEIAFSYYYHPTASQVNGAAAIGMSFPLN
ncbi:hypothetical protein [Pontimicrobium sp. IMCC45349]|uniref:hypothetical protein n=1 Tax=Pontimicrobium sp. IMCC45349 TaxID=3391574 RepID=UPI0039A0C396